MFALGFCGLLCGAKLRKFTLNASTSLKFIYSPSLVQHNASPMMYSKGEYWYTHPKCWFSEGVRNACGPHPTSRSLRTKSRITTETNGRFRQGLTLREAGRPSPALLLPALYLGGLKKAMLGHRPVLSKIYFIQVSGHVRNFRLWVLCKSH